MNDFMNGRNGADELTIVMGFAGIVIAMIGSIARIQWLSWIAIAVIVIGVLRGLSKNIDARHKENEAFVAATANVPGLGKFVASLGGGAAAANASRAAGTSKETLNVPSAQPRRCGRAARPRPILSAPNCGQMLSFPKGKGKIRVTCPKCHAKMETRS